MGEESGWWGRGYGRGVGVWMWVGGLGDINQELKLLVEEHKGIVQY